LSFFSVDLAAQPPKSTYYADLYLTYVDINCQDNLSYFYLTIQELLVEIQVKTASCF